MRRPLFNVAASVLALTVVGCSGESTQDEQTVGGLSLRRGTPAIVATACEQAQKQVAIAVICPDLTPQSRYTQSIGLWGPMVFSPTAYALTFNNGDVGEGFVHWIVGAGKAAEIRLHVLSDRNNVVKGSPRLSASRERDGSTIEIYEFPPHPAGGPNGGHGAAFISCGSQLLFASIHGPAHVAAAEEMALDLARLANCSA